MRLKKGDLVKVLEPDAHMYGKVGQIIDIFRSAWNTDVTVEFRMPTSEVHKYRPDVIYAEGIYQVVMTEIYQPFQLLRIPNDKLGKLLYV